MRYYGCKRKLLDFISEGVTRTGINGGSVFCDLFSGTTTVAKYFKQKGFTVYANDFLEFSYSLARAYIQNNNYPKFKGLKHIVPGLNGSEQNIATVIPFLNNLRPKKGFIYKNYCPGGTEHLGSPRMYFTNINGMKIDAIREKIQEWKEQNVINNNEFYILLTALIEAVPFVANISGNYAAYLKHWDPRTHKRLILDVPQILESDKRNKAFKQDANKLIKRIHSDILYLDPPYNARQYAGNYFLLELIAEGWFDHTKPNIYGKTGMRPYENQKSKYCQKNNVLKVFADLVENADTRFILLNYNDEGLLSEEEISTVLVRRGEVNIFRKTHRRYKSINQKPADRSSVKEKLYFVKVFKS